MKPLAKYLGSASLKLKITLANKMPAGWDMTAFAGIAMTFPESFPVSAGEFGFTLKWASTFLFAICQVAVVSDFWPCVSGPQWHPGFRILAGTTMPSCHQVSRGNTAHVCHRSLWIGHRQARR